MYRLTMGLVPAEESLARYIHQGQAQRLSCNQHVYQGPRCCHVGARDAVVTGGPARLRALY